MVESTGTSFGQIFIINNARIDQTHQTYIKILKLVTRGKEIPFIPATDCKQGRLSGKDTVRYSFRSNRTIQGF